MVLAAVGQICSRNNVQWNLKICRSVLSRAAASGAKFVCLPEAADYICPSDEGPSGLCLDPSYRCFGLTHCHSPLVSDSATTSRLHMIHTYISTYTVLKLAQKLDDNTFVKGIQEQAKESKIWVSVGIHELPSSSSTQANGHSANGEQEDKERVYNTQCLISPEGELASVYRKLHLFDVNFKGGMQTSESETTMKGTELSDITQTTIGKGVSNRSCR